MHGAAKQSFTQHGEVQVGVAALLGTLVALTLWMLYLLLTWPSPHSHNVATEAEGASKKSKKREKKEGKKTK